MVQRYEIYVHSESSCNKRCGVTESTAGEYIRYDDALEALKKCEKQGAYNTMIFLSDAIKSIEGM